MKVVINSCYGGFGLSQLACDRYLEITGKSINKYSDDRADPVLVRVVEELQEEANGLYSELKIVEIPNDVEWQIEEYDGSEWIAEKHRIWT